jgi:pyridoxal phosphate enzyme (YggS family)
VSGLEWHFIGRLQSNKIKQIASHFAWVHSVSSKKIAKSLSDHAADHHPLNICLQVNVDNDPNKEGVTISELTELAKYVSGLPHLQLRGLMTIPREESNEAARGMVFQMLREQLQLVNQTLQLNMDTLSMGMSEDYTLAIQQGATILRIGRALFGERGTLEKNEKGV